MDNVWYPGTVIWEAVPSTLVEVMAQSERIACVGKSVASGERYYIREANVWRDRSESGVGHVGQLSTAQ